MPAREHGRAVLLRPPQCLHGQVSRAEWPDCGRRRTKRRSKTPEKCRATPQMKDPSGGNFDSPAEGQKPNKISDNSNQRPADQGQKGVNMEGTESKIDTPLTRGRSGPVRYT